MIPPGLEDQLAGAHYEVFAVGGDVNTEWLPDHGTKDFTNAFIADETNKKMLLGWKKRGFAKGTWNGFGGKVDPGETIAEAALRELKEEAGISAPLQHWGFLYFQSRGHPYAHRINVYRAYDWSGEPTETEEMKPAWFEFRPSTERVTETDAEPGMEGTSVPWDKMWEDDKFWLPLIWDRGRQFVGRVDFSEFGDITKGTTSAGEGASMLRWWFATVGSGMIDAQPDSGNQARPSSETGAEK